MRFAVIVVAISCSCRSETTNSTLPASVSSETMVVLGDEIVQTTPDKLTVRSATHGGVELEWSRPQPESVTIDDRGTLVVRYASETCLVDLDGDSAVLACGDLVIAYLHGVVVVVGREPIRVIGTREVLTLHDLDCGTHTIDESVMIAGVTIAVRGYRIVRCVGGGTPAPLIF